MVNAPCQRINSHIAPLTRALGVSTINLKFKIFLIVPKLLNFMEKRRNHVPLPTIP